MVRRCATAGERSCSGVTPADVPGRAREVESAGAPALNAATCIAQASAMALRRGREYMAKISVEGFAGEAEGGSACREHPTKDK